MVLADEVVRHGGTVRRDEVVGLETDAATGQVTGVALRGAGTTGVVPAGSFVNAAGPFSGALSRRILPSHLPDPGFVNELHGKVIFHDREGVVPADSPMVILGDETTVPWRDDEREWISALADSPEDFFDALGQAIGRYRNCVTQAGEIIEYRDAQSGKVLAFSQEATKGRVIRGQWYYSTDQAAQSYVWMRSVEDLVARAIEADDIDVVDLGPSGTDAFEGLKERYGFLPIVDWHLAADYAGPFVYEGGAAGAGGGLLETLFPVRT